MAQDLTGKTIFFSDDDLGSGCQPLEKWDLTMFHWNNSWEEGYCAVYSVYKYNVWNYMKISGACKQLQQGLIAVSTVVHASWLYHLPTLSSCFIKIRKIQPSNCIEWTNLTYSHIISISISLKNLGERQAILSYRPLIRSHRRSPVIYRKTQGVKNTYIYIYFTRYNLSILPLKGRDTCNMYLYNCRIHK